MWWLPQLLLLFLLLLLLFIYLLTAIGLMPGGSVTKIGRTYKKMDIHSKETKHTSHDKAARTSHEKQHISQNFTVQYKCNEQNTRYDK
jgi:hypothetical protein